MRDVVSKLFIGSAMVALSLPLPAHAQVALYKAGGLALDGTIQAGAAYIGSTDPGFGSGTVGSGGARRSGRLNGIEGYVKPGLAATYDAGAFSLYGAASAIGAATRGSGDANFPANLTPGQPEKLRLEDLYIGARSGTLFSGLPDNALDLSFGRQSFQIGDGFLIADGNADGGRKAAYWLAPRTAFARTAIAKIETGTPLRADVFALRNDSSQSDALTVAQPARTSLYGVNAEWIDSSTGKDGKVQKNWTVGSAYLRLYDADTHIAPSRDGMNVYDIRAQGHFIPTLPALGLAGEYVYEHNGDAGKKMSADSWYLQPSWTFSSIGWTPTLSYRYAHFSGTPQGASKNEAYDPLFYGAAGGYGTWYMGEITGQYVLLNTNENVHMLHLKVQPAETLDFGVIAYNFRFDEKPAGVTSNNAFNEVNLYSDYAPLPWLTLTGVLGAAKAQSGGKQFVAAAGPAPTNDRTWYLMEVGATVKF